MVRLYQSLTFVLILLFGLNLNAQDQQRISELKSVLSSEAHDTLKLDATIDLATILKKSDPENALKYAEDGIKNSEQLAEFSRLGKCYQLKGVILKYQGDFESALLYYNKGIEAFKKDNNVQGQALCLNNIGVVLKNLSKLDTAMLVYEEATKLFESIDDSAGVGKVLMNKGIVAKHKGQHEKAIQLYMGALTIYEANGNKASIAKCCNNLSNLYRKQGMFEESRKVLNRALEINIELGAKQEEALTYTNLGTVSSSGFGDLETALDYFSKSEAIYLELGNRRGVADCKLNKAYVYIARDEDERALALIEQGLEIFLEIEYYVGIIDAYISSGELYAKQGQYDKGLSYMKKALQMAESSGEIDDVIDAHKKIAYAYDSKGDYKSAFYHFKTYHDISDSINGLESKKQIMELQAMFDSERKEKEISIQRAELQKRDAELAEKDARQSTMNWIVGLGILVMIGVVVGLVVNRNKNRRLAAQNEEITDKNVLIEAKNRDIMDSIQYAKRLQDAILPPAEFVSSTLGDAFVMYKPKDVVSGDFFWVEKRESKVLLGVIDCTGHGVPGAFMSIVGHNGLHQAFAENNLVRPGEILDHLNKSVSATLRQKESSNQQVRDGMDAALCSIDRESGTLEFAGAMNPIFILRDGELQVIKGDKRAIGSSEDFQAQHYTNHQVDIQPGDCIYLFSDGYQDQFGGKNDKKFKIKRFKELLLSNYKESMEQQLQHLETRFEEWRGNLEQLDDVCVVGVRV